MSSSSRLLHLDALKALAAQAIVLHHLSAYGPVAESVGELLPALMAGLYDYGRMAVQVFLVVGGFLSARALAPQRQPLQGAPGSLLWRRYLRLMLPFMAAVLLTLACSMLVARWLPDLVPASVSAPQLLAHALLVHDVFGYEALTVGAWYVAIDLQLFALLLGLLWLARQVRARIVAPALVLALAMASLWAFNLDASLDVWAPYHFGAYGLGALVHWLSLSQWRRRWLWTLALLVTAALAFDFRGRIALALVTALALAWAQQRHHEGRLLLQRSAWARGIVGHLGTHSYALFLVHFPIVLLVNAQFERRGSHGWLAVAAMATAWLLSNLAALPFHRWIEAPSARLRLGWPRLLSV